MPSSKQWSKQQGQSQNEAQDREESSTDGSSDNEKGAPKPVSSSKDKVFDYYFIIIISIGTTSQQ